ncbi:MAG TPA: VOC family protein [Steroidobacteraceae bacterium]|nr:VOC family protein [Steroidobacteraceae bacterium]
MKKILTATALALCAIPALADVSLNGARVGAHDPEAVAKFYEAAFGMSEVQRIPNQGGPEIMLNFGKTPQAAQANRTKLGGADIVIMYRASDDAKDEIAHIVLNLTNMDATVAAVKAAGGKMAREPFVYGGSIKIGIAVDPAGNQIEMIQGAGQAAAPKKPGT